MALADFHYTTGISSGFKVYILEGQPSFENEQKFRRLPSHRFPVYSIKHKLSADVRSPDRTSEGQKVSKVRRLAYQPMAVSLKQTLPPTGQILEGPAATPCVTMFGPSLCGDSRTLHPSCPYRCPLRKPLTVSQLQQMRPSVITCAPRRNSSETLTSTSHSRVSPPKQRNEEPPSSPPSQRFCTWTTSSAGLSTRFSGETSLQREAEDQNPHSSH